MVFYVENLIDIKKYSRKILNRFEVGHIVSEIILYFETSILYCIVNELLLCWRYCVTFLKYEILIEKSM